MKSPPLCIALVGLLLSGCAGGGGAAVQFTPAPPQTVTPEPLGPPPPDIGLAPDLSPYTPFTSWPNTPFPGAYALNGVGMAVDRASLLFTERNWGPVISINKAALTFAGNGDLTDAIVASDTLTYFKTAPVRPTNFSTVQQDLGSGSLAMKRLEIGDNDESQLRVISYADPAANGFSYLTFGWWFSSAWAGVPDTHGWFAVGSLTPGQAIPTSGNVQFAGALTGQLVTGDTTAAFAVIAAPVTIDVDFAARSAVFSSTNFRDTHGTIYTGTGLSGTLTYASQQNALDGQLTSTLYAGAASARFFGPGAEEIGGGFVLSPTDPNSAGRVVGAFGAGR